MTNIKELMKSSHIQIALASGISMLTIACFTRWILKKPIDPFLLAIPALIEAAYEYVLKKHKDSKICRTWIWIVAILASTILILLVSWILNM